MKRLRTKCRRHLKKAAAARDIIRPKLTSNPKHHKNSNTPQREDAENEKLYERCGVERNGERYTIGDDGVIHRYSASSNGEVHRNGSSVSPGGLHTEDIQRNNGNNGAASR